MDSKELEQKLDTAIEKLNFIMIELGLDTDSGSAFTGCITAHPRHLDTPTAVLITNVKDI